MTNRTIPPIVSTQWLGEYSAGIVILDVRIPDDCKAGCMPGSISEPFVYFGIVIEKMSVDKAGDIPGAGIYKRQLL